MLGRFGFEQRDDTLGARLKRQQTGLPIEARICGLKRLALETAAAYERMDAATARTDRCLQAEGFRVDS
jgi:hypothetical protein